MIVLCARLSDAASHVLVGPLLQIHLKTTALPEATFALVHPDQAREINWSRCMGTYDGWYDGHGRLRQQFACFTQRTTFKKEFD